jgi:Cdc6-like AAA superfamily ATPase
MTKNLQERCKSSKRIDDSLDTIKKRINNYVDNTIPMFEYYKTFGRVRTIDGLQDKAVINQETKNMITPQAIFLIGSKCSGKTVLAHKVAARTNTKLINFNDFLKENGLRKRDDETIILAFIKHFMYEKAPRVLIEGFP